MHLMTNDVDTFAQHLPFVHPGLSLIASPLGPVLTSAVETWVDHGKVGPGWTTKRNFYKGPDSTIHQILFLNQN